MTLRTKTAHQQRVEGLMTGAKQEIPDRPTLPDEKTRLLRAQLILEEALETVRELGFRPVIITDRDDIDLSNKDDFNRHVGFLTSGHLLKRPGASIELSDGSVFEPNLEGIADGCADVSVVTIGTLSACGIADDSVLREVDENNLRKFEHHCPKCDGPGVVAGSPVEPGRRICRACNGYWQSGHHNEAGKWVKPETHKPPRIANVLEEQTKAVAYYDEAKQRVAERKEAKIARRESGACFGWDYSPNEDVCKTCDRRVDCVDKFVGA